MILSTHQFVRISEIKKTKLNCFAYYGQRELCRSPTASPSKAESRLLTLILPKVLGNMKFKDWQNFRGMNSLVEERLLQETAVDWWVGTQRYVFLEGVPF